MIVEQYRQLARYNAWMNRNLYATAGLATDEQRRRNLGAFFRSIHGTVSHILLCDRGWLWRFTGDRTISESLDSAGKPIPITGDLGQELYADFELLRHEREKTDAAIVQWTSALDLDRLQGPLVYRATDGSRREHPLWWAVTHFFNHQTHHRGQVTTLLKQLGYDPGVTDFVRLPRDEVETR